MPALPSPGGTGLARSRAYVPASALVFDIVGTWGRASALRFVRRKFPGGHRSRVTPVPIPNTEVKPVSADGTACVSAWESRSLPGVSQSPPSSSWRASSCTRQ